MIRAFLCFAFLFCALQSAAAASQRWIVVSDIHLDPYASAAEPSDAASDTNLALFRSSLRAMRAAVPDPQMVVIGGDFLAHHFPALADSARGRDAADPEAVRTMRSIAQAFATAFPRAHFAIVLGNNDDPCGDYQAEAGGPYLRALADIWAPLVDRDGASPDFRTTFGRGGYASASIPGQRAKILMLDSVYWSFFYRGGCSRSTYNPGDAELAWLRTQLAAGETAIPIMHIPPGVDATSTRTSGNFIGVPFLHDGPDRALSKIFESSKVKIPWAVATHEHRNDVRLVGGVPFVIAASLSPIYRNDPVFFVYDIAPDASLTDMTPYAYDADSDRWSARESFDSAWSVRGFTAATVLDIHDRLASDPDLRQMWGERFVSWGWRVDDINAQTWRIYWCAQTEDHGAFAGCAGTGRRFAKIVGGILAIVVTISLASTLLWLRSRRMRA